MLAGLDPRTLDDQSLTGLLAGAGLTVGGRLALPQRMAPVNALLEVAPAPVREALLLGVLDLLARPAAPSGTPDGR